VAFFFPVPIIEININTMINNLRLTTERNTEQDWLKTNLARFTGMLQSFSSATSPLLLLEWSGSDRPE